MMLDVSLIIPTYNEEQNVPIILHNIKLLKTKETTIIDGNSQDKTRLLLNKFKIISTKASRGFQLATGAKNSSQTWLLFLHADTKMTKANVTELKKFIKKNYNKVAYFHLKFNNKSFLAKIIAKWANIRTKLFYLPFGDQCLLIKKNYYNDIGGFADIPKMEDMKLILKIPKKNKYFFKTYLKTSFQKYQKNGVIKQSLNNIFNQIIFFLK